MITRFYLPLLSTNVKHPKFGCHVTSLCQGLRRSAGSGGEEPENQVDFSYHRACYSAFTNTISIKRARVRCQNRNKEDEASSSVADVSEGESEEAQPENKMLRSTLSKLGAATTSTGVGYQ